MASPGHYGAQAVGVRGFESAQPIDSYHARLNDGRTSLFVSLAHELGQPLGAILHNAEAAGACCSTPPDLEEVHDILADMQKDNQRAGAVINQMRSLLKRAELNTACWISTCSPTKSSPSCTRRPVRAKSGWSLIPIHFRPCAATGFNCSRFARYFCFNAMDAMNELHRIATGSPVHMQVRAHRLR